MNHLLEESVSSEELKKFEARYELELETTGKIDSSVQFHYAWALIRSEKRADIVKGIYLMEQLFQNPDESGKRDYLFFLAIGNTRIKNYEAALKYTTGLLQVEPENSQVKELDALIRKKMRHYGLIGIGIVGGAAAVAVGGIVGLAAVAVAAAIKSKK